MLAEESERKAAEFIECAEGMRDYFNYLSEDEAMDITSKFVNCDGTYGAKWSADALFKKVASLGGDVEILPFFNKWSLYVTMNMIHSDYYKVIDKWCGGDADKYAEACYDLSICRLEDADNERWVRNYFCV